MKLSKKKADRNELYGHYIMLFSSEQKTFTFEQYVKMINKLKKEFKNMKG